MTTPVTVWSQVDRSSNFALSNGALTAAATADSVKLVRATAPINGVKAYYELTYTTKVNTGAPIVGFADVSTSLSSYPGEDINSCGFQTTGSVYFNNATTVSGLPSWDTAGSTIGIAIDDVNQKMWWNVAGTWYPGSGADPATNTGGQSYAGATSGADRYAAAHVYYNGAAVTANFGATSFTGTVPTGFGAYNDLATYPSALWNPSDKTAGITVSGTANSTATSTSASQQNVRSKIWAESGKLYFQITLLTFGINDGVGVSNNIFDLNSSGAGYGSGGNSIAYFPKDGGRVRYSGTQIVPSSVSDVNGATIDIALDVANGKLWFRSDATAGSSTPWNGDGLAIENPVTGAGGLHPYISGVGEPVFAVFSTLSSGSQAILNMGNSTFTRPAPSGFVAFDPYSSGGGGTTVKQPQIVVCT